LGSREAPLGLLYIASYLADKGYDVTILDGENLKEEEVISKIGDLCPDVVGVTSTTFSFFDASKLIKNVRRLLPSALLLMGGPHVSALPRDTLEKIPALDGGVFGEGEETLLEIVTGKSVNGIAGLAWRDKNGIIRLNPKRPLSTDLDRYRLNWDLLSGFPNSYQPAWQSRQKNRVISLVTSRGCSFSCIFCAGSCVHGKVRRAHSPLYIVNMMCELFKRFGSTVFYFHDDHFTLNDEWLEEFCDRLIHLGDIFRWSCASRVESLNDKILRTMRQAGCYQIGVGVESGSENILRWLAKGTTTDIMEKGIRRIHLAGMETKVYLMLGTPQETIGDVTKTLRLVSRLPIDHVQVVYFTPLPGSAAYNSYQTTPRQWLHMNLLNPMTKSSLPNWMLRLLEFGIYAYVYGRSTGNPSRYSSL
jgi:radical SAM superfamily enzyme YgiQ (UPF0313 family)